MLINNLTEKPFIIAGPCVMESEDILKQIAETVQPLCEELGFTYVFKASFDKANRTSISSFRGPGLEDGLRWLENIKKLTGLPVTTDIHEPNQAAPVGEICDIVQIPAFLCRQTDLLVEAAKTGKIVNIKKAQFLSGVDMIHPVEKVRQSGNDQVMLTERGTMFGYNNLVVDYRNLVDMQEICPVVMDVTHSTQKPGGLGGKSGGDRRYAPYLASAAASVGVRGFFFEVHPDPDSAKSDGPNMIPLAEFGDVLRKVKKHIY